MKRIAIILALCLLLSGCSLMSGEHLSVTPHESPVAGNQTANRSVSDYGELKDVLEAMVRAGTESMVINVARYNEKLLDNGIKTAVTHLKESFPLGAWAVEDVEYEIGTGGGQRVVSVNISSFSIIWSEGETTMVASGFLCRSLYVAYAMHGAVFLAYGSRSRLALSSSGICSITRSLYFSAVTIRMFS